MRARAKHFELQSLIMLARLVHPRAHCINAFRGPDFKYIRRSKRFIVISPISKGMLKYHRSKLKAWQFYLNNL